MNVNFWRRPPSTEKQLATIIQNQTLIMAKLSTLSSQLAGLETTLNKVKTEVETLKGQLGDVDIPADAQATLDRLGVLSKALDDLNPDAP